MKRLFLLFALLGMISGSMTRAQSDPAAAGLAQGIELFRAGMAQWDPEGFQRAIQALEKTVHSEPGFPARYWLAASRFNQVLCLRSRGEEDASRWQEVAESLDAALDLNPSDPECYVMRGVINGMRISQRPTLAIRLGPRVFRDQRQALKLGETNPRVHYLNGTSIFRASKGRDAAKALKELKEAEKLFERERGAEQKKTEPQWGYDHCLQLMAEILESQGDSSGAISYYEKALTVNPELKRAQDGLKKLTGS